VELDRVIHERVRLAIVSALAGAPSLSFNELKDLLDITDGNLSVTPVVSRKPASWPARSPSSNVSRVPSTDSPPPGAKRSTSTSITWNH
jgi:hypothetical protein